MTLVPTRRICVVTGSRADYGHLAPVMRAIKADPDLALQVIVCGQHLDQRFGETWRAIAQDGFEIDARVDLALGDDSRLAMAQATGRGVSGIAEALAKLSPDIALVLGDRYEIFAAGAAALLLSIPLAHVHGGELTEAAVDDALRHALSKMASLHFAAAAPYGQRLVQMGEDPSRVIVSGAPGLDQVANLAPFTREEMAPRLGIPIRDPLLLITYHPVTSQKDDGLAGAKALLKALDGRPGTMIFTGVNSDPGHAEIAKLFAEFVAKAPNERLAVPSLGQRGYLSAVRLAAAVIGNSSSGLIEAPALGAPTVNIGDRQKGRLRSPGVIDCGEDFEAITAAITKALDPPFRARAQRATPAYGRGGAAARIVATLKSVPLTQLSIKRFHDILPR